MEQQESFVEKVIYKIVKRHIAGYTMDSSLKKAMDLNGKKIGATIAFLSSIPEDRAKANYVINTYVQLLREIARRGINASVHVRQLRLGHNPIGGSSIADIKRVAEASKKYSVPIWIDTDPSIAEDPSMQKSYASVGKVFDSYTAALQYFKKGGEAERIMIPCKKANDGELKKKDIADFFNAVEKLCSHSKKVVLKLPTENVLHKILKNGSRYRDVLSLEFPLGYNEKKVFKIAKDGNARLSVYIPFGKDWIGYAIDSVPEGYIRALASRLLGGKGVGSE
ncbi:MAG: hypothetical protein QW144_00015 [Candidatus Micrarchaeaceae archaeon]